MHPPDNTKPTYARAKALNLQVTRGRGIEKYFAQRAPSGSKAELVIIIHANRGKCMQTLRTATILHCVHFVYLPRLFYDIIILHVRERKERHVGRVNYALQHVVGENDRLV